MDPHDLLWVAHDRVTRAAHARESATALTPKDEVDRLQAELDRALDLYHVAHTGTLTSKSDAEVL